MCVTSSKSSTDKYLSTPSGKIVTIFFPGYFSAAFLAPTIAAPEEIPIPIHVESKKFLFSSIASSLLTVYTSSM